MQKASSSYRRNSNLKLEATPEVNKLVNVKTTQIQTNLKACPLNPLPCPPVHLDMWTRLHIKMVL